MTAPELLVILIVCILGIAPVFIFMFALIFPDHCCTLMNQRHRRTRNRSGERTVLLPSAETGYIADDEQSSNISIGYDSSLTQSGDSEVYQENTVAGPGLPSLTIMWHPLYLWGVRPSKRRDGNNL